MEQFYLMQGHRFAENHETGRLKPLANPRTD